MPDIVISPNRFTTTGTPSISFVGVSGSGIALNVTTSGSVQFAGNAGNLFQINDNLSGTLWRINTDYGATVFDVASDGTMVVGMFSSYDLIVTGGRVGMGTGSPATNLHVTGVGRFDAGVIANGVYIYPALTGDYSIRSGAASVAQLYGLSGFVVANSALPASVAFLTGAAGQTFTQPIVAKNYSTTTSGVATPVILGNPATVSGRLNLDFAAAGLQMATITGGTVISGVNYSAGASVTLRLFAAAGGGFTTAQQIAYPTGWRFVSSYPTGLAVNKMGILTVQCFMTSALETGVAAAFAVEP